MSWQRKLSGGVLGFIGFMLSPLSWWNDLFVNVPLAVAAAGLVALIYPPVFKTAVVAAYCLSHSKDILESITDEAQQQRVQ